MTNPKKNVLALSPSASLLGKSVGHDFDAFVPSLPESAARKPAFCLGKALKNLVFYVRQGASEKMVAVVICDITTSFLV